MNNQQNSKLNLHNTIASRIKQRLIDLDMQQKDIIDALGVPKSTVSEWVKKNEKRTPNTEYLIELAKCLNCSVDYLVGTTDAPTPLINDKQKTLRLVCDYTGLKENTIDFFSFNNSLKDKGQMPLFNKIFIDFIEYLICDFDAGVSMALLYELLFKDVEKFKVAVADFSAKMNSTKFSDPKEKARFYNKNVKNIDELKTSIYANKHQLIDLYTRALNEFVSLNCECPMDSIDQTINELYSITHQETALKEISTLANTKIKHIEINKGDKNE